jgi:hypothetical protein
MKWAPDFIPDEAVARMPSLAWLINSFPSWWAYDVDRKGWVLK